MRIRFANNYRAEIASAVSAPYTAISLITGEVTRLVDAAAGASMPATNAESVAVPVSLLDSAGEPITNTAGTRMITGYITAWDTTSGTPDAVTVAWEVEPEATIPAGAFLAVRQTGEDLARRAQTFFGDNADASASTGITVRYGDAERIAIAANSVDIEITLPDPSTGPAGMPTQSAVVVVNNSGAYTGATISVVTSIRFDVLWKSGAAPAFASGAQIIRIEFLPVTGGLVLGDWAIYN